MHPQRSFRTLVLVLFAAAALHAQAPAPATAVYEVVSIHPADPNKTSSHVMMNDGQFDAANAQLWGLISTAFGVSMQEQILGIPPTLREAHFDILAKPDADTVAMLKGLSREDTILASQHMMRALLEERFALKAHTETRELPVYLLEIAKGGAKLTESDPAKIPNAFKGPDGKLRGGGMLQIQFGKLTAQGSSIQQFALNLQFQAHRLIHDQTNLTGRYDFTLTWNPDPMSTNADTTKPDLFTALEEQLGLKLVPGKAPTTVVIIDHLEPPTPN